MQEYCGTERQHLVIAPLPHPDLPHSHKERSFLRRSPSTLLLLLLTPCAAHPPKTLGGHLGGATGCAAVSLSFPLDW